MRDETVYLRHILDEIAFLKRSTQGRSLEDLKNDDYFSHAVRSAIEIIGEAANNVPDQIKSENPDIPWREMSALRNRIIHGYFRIDYAIVWDVINEDLRKVEPVFVTLVEETEKKQKTGRNPH